MTTAAASTDTTVADTIAAQISGYGPLRAMLNVYAFVLSKDSLVFDVGVRTANKANHVCVTLCADDTYRIDFCRYGKTMRSAMRTTNIEIVHGVYAAELRGVIEDRLGLRVSL